jgi:transcription elongation factor Elf1
MDRPRNDLLAEMARDAALERSDFLVRAGEQLERFLRDQGDRIRELGGLTLIDDDPDYLAMAPDGTFRSRSRIYDEATGEWHSETEIIETGGELVELYNPADVFQAFADAAREGVWSEGDGDDDAGGSGSTGEGTGTATVLGLDAPDPYAEAADRWAAGQPEVPIVDDAASAAAALYGLALDFQERSQRSEAGLIEQFEHAASSLTGKVGTIVIVDDLDEHLELSGPGFHGRVIPEGETAWTELEAGEDVVRFYDPTDVFGDLADAIAEAYPEVAGDDDDEEDGEDGEDGEDHDDEDGGKA